jgi:hypothetical protein
MNKGSVRWREGNQNFHLEEGEGVDLGESPSCTVGNQTHYVQWLRVRIVLQTVLHEVWWLHTGV